MSAVLCDDRLQLWPASEVARGEVPEPHRGPLGEILRWSREFLMSSHPELGRTGPVCPYTAPSLRKDLYFLGVPVDDGSGVDLPSMVAQLRDWHGRLSADLSQEDQELLALLVVLPDLDHEDSTELDELQRKAKDEFVADGLMIGQFHPVCPEPGLWSRTFRPLRSPSPLLAVRRLLVFDLPFLESEAHLAQYLRRFAATIPARMRDQLVSRLTHSGVDAA
ncbi:DUF6875 domain-containing protein [Actinophytocola gossypii]|uniref:DUF6875 domain-containing protein n=1 Tax=Actinophytocola gossypii TaxID=2812003 RepID=A0ABT2J287_9PSEU|nr:hypothetical protein [Actinophytocola gossypii]MCT2581968.1 hypothetical protein [Actinophytocola gossypii]